MRRRVLSLFIALVVAAALPAAQAPKAADENKLVGKWSGTFDGDTSGSYSMAFEHHETKKVVGTLQTMPATGDGYTATFKSILVSGTKVNLAYDAPNGEPIEIQIEATLDGGKLTGTWKVIETASKSVTQSGKLVGTKS